MDERRAEPVRILDTTLRDGALTPGVRFELRDRIEIADALTAMRIDVVEIGFTKLEPNEIEAARVLASRLRDVTACVLVRPHAAAIEAAAETLRGAAHPRLHLYLTGGEARRVASADAGPRILERLDAAVREARRHVPEVQLSIVDGVRLDGEALAAITRAALRAGARFIGVPDTAGSSRPDTIETVYRNLRARVPALSGATLSFHGHDDERLASTNSLRAVRAGARQIEVTVNGLGPRGGNAALDNVAAALQARGRSLGVTTAIDAEKLPALSRLVAERSGTARLRGRTA